MGAAVVVVVMVFMAVGNIGGIVSAGIHHVVGADEGWDAAWSSGKSFRVGDSIWFTSSGAQESIAEVGSQAEYESCDVSNPIRMYTSGLDRVELNQQGQRFFASAATDNCNKGLKLHIRVEPDSSEQILPQQKAVACPFPPFPFPPPSPSGAISVPPAWLGLNWIRLALLCVVCFL